jgi:hypothetical protein
MKTFKIKIINNTVTYENVALTDDQINHFKTWLVDSMGCEDEEELIEENWDPIAFNDYLEDEGIEKTIVKIWPSTDVEFRD